MLYPRYGALQALATAFGTLLPDYQRTHDLCATFARLGPCIPIVRADLTLSKQGMPVILGAPH